MNARLLSCAAVSLAFTGPAFPQEEDYRVYTASPRLILTPQRLRLVQRERERESMRWEQLNELLSGSTPMSEPGMAWALEFQVAKEAAAGRKAVEWALSDAANPQRDLRQLALVFDWCASAMTAAQADQLAAKLQRGLAGAAPRTDDVRGYNARALAAIALADRLPDHGEAVLKSLIQDWWRASVAKKIAAGEPAIPREQLYALYEMFHALRDNLKIDLRESSPAYFKPLPLDLIAGHYPAPLEGPENDFRIPVYSRTGEPDLTEAALSRAAGLAMVAFDNNALECQFLQGWLMQDRFQMRGPLGSVYEFLWANPYQPGLSYYKVPLVYHDAGTGHVFARTSWDEDATWIGYFDGNLQMFRDGQVQALRAGAATQPVRVGSAVLMTAASKDAAKFHADAQALFILNLAPQSAYDVEIDDQELSEGVTDAGGTLVLALPEGTDADARIRKRP